jgi:exopolyphosphatase / guanosine-5'-triphosphate,3'-diphosphate pyrophosphatase
VGELRGSDLRIVAEQLGRRPTVAFTVVARCRGGHPLVIRNAPVDDEGDPFPTTFWLTCPEAVRAVSRLEADGWISKLNERVEVDPRFADAVARAHAEYARERARGGAEAASGGVGGTRRGLKCLHAHYANRLAGGADEVGAWVARMVEPIHDERPGRVAAVDQGTNSIRLLVAEPDGRGGFDELARDMVITRLGEGVDRNGRLTPEALERTADVLARYARRAQALHAGRIRVAATAALRDASNAREFERRAYALTGSELEIVSGEREAALSFLGGTRGLDAPAPFLVLDIGGGSSEFVLGSDRPSVAVSMQMGSVRLTERLIRTDPPTADELDDVRASVDEVLDEVERAVPVAEARTLVAVSGTATTVQAIALDLSFYDPERIHRTRLSRQDAALVVSRFAAMTTSERAALPVMAAGRADVIVAGAIVLLAVMERFGFDDGVVSETDILDGMVLEMLELV